MSSPEFAMLDQALGGEPVAVPEVIDATAVRRSFLAFSGLGEDVAGIVFDGEVRYLSGVTDEQVRNGVWRWLESFPEDGDLKQMAVSMTAGFFARFGQREESPIEVKKRRVLELAKQGIWPFERIRFKENRDEKSPFDEAVWMDTVTLWRSGGKPFEVKSGDIVVYSVHGIGFEYAVRHSLCVVLGKFDGDMYGPDCLWVMKLDRSKQTFITGNGQQRVESVQRRFSDLSSDERNDLVNVVADEVFDYELVDVDYHELMKEYIVLLQLFFEIKFGADYVRRVGRSYIRPCKDFFGDLPPNDCNELKRRVGLYPAVIEALYDWQVRNFPNEKVFEFYPEEKSFEEIESRFGGEIVCSHDWLNRGDDDKRWGNLKRFADRSDRYTSSTILKLRELKAEKARECKLAWEQMEAARNAYIYMMQTDDGS